MFLVRNSHIHGDATSLVGAHGEFEDHVELSVVGHWRVDIVPGVEDYYPDHGAFGVAEPARQDTGAILRYMV